MQLATVNGIKSGIRFATAGLLAFIFYHWFDLQFGFWAVVTIAAVMHPNLQTTTKKCVLRLIGTILGVILSIISLQLIKQFPYLLYAIFFINMFISGILIFADKKNNYLGVMCGVTIIIIITAYIIEPSLTLNVIFTRTLDVIMGILIGWLCSRFLFPIQHGENVDQFNFALTINTFQMKYAFAIALATTLSLLPWFSLHYSGGYWAPIACLIIMEETSKATERKGFDRFFAHVIVLLFAAILSVMLDTTYGIAMALVIGLFIFGYLMENPILNFGSGIANTMAIAFCIVLLSSPGQVNTIHTALARFINTLLGIAIGMIIVHVMDKAHHRSSKY